MSSDQYQRDGVSGASVPAECGAADQPVRWRVEPFEQLERIELYRLLAARIEVFVVEQNCPYPELDGRDPQAWHIWAEAPDGQPLAYARLLPPGVSYREPSIGRVLTARAGRGRGLGRKLMLLALEQCQQRFPGQGVRIGAQQYLQAFYQSLGFSTVRGPYLEDGIPHLEMLREASK